MFSSDNSSLPLYYNQSPSFTSNDNPESNNIFFQHFHHEKLLSTNYPPISDNSIVNLSSQPSINQQETILCPTNNVTMNRVSSSNRPAGKKDRHTKITTAQGVRDRRVRLSMNIAREFFNLQDMLGFDKASKTLGWLLAKCKADIDEVASTSNFKFIETSIEETKKRETNYLKNGRNVAKESKRREEARERARERTRNKKIVNNHHINHVNHPQSSYNYYNYEMINSKYDQESCGYYNDYVNQPPGFPDLNIINLSTGY